MAHWARLRALVAESRALADVDDRVHFVATKVRALVAEQDAGRGAAPAHDDAVPEHATDAFVAAFPALARERIVGYWHGTLHGALPTRATLFATTEHVALKCTLRDDVVLAWREVTAIERKAVLLLVDSAMRITTRDGVRHMFATVHRDEACSLLEQLWANSVDRMQQRVAASADGGAAVAAAATTTTTASRHALDRAREQAAIRRTLHLPADEALTHTFDCALWVPKPQQGYVHGTFVVSANVFGFVSSDDRRGISLVLPLSRITDITASRTFIGLIDNGLTLKTLLDEFHVRTLVARGEHLRVMHGALMRYRDTAAERAAALRRDSNAEAYDDRLGQRRWAATGAGVGDDAFQRAQHELASRWAAYFVANGVLNDLCLLRRHVQLLQLARAGCPNELRGAVWQTMSGAAYLRERDPNQFRALLRAHGADATRAAAEIQTDLHRSSTHPFFARNDEAYESLRRVLVAYSARNPTIGYCQGMNIISAFFLLFQTEEEAFWQLTYVCEELLPGYFNDQLSGARIDIEVFSMLVKLYLPKLHKHLQKIGLGLELVCLPWFMVLFIGYVPFEAAARVIDCVFVDGPDVLFSIALALLAHVETRLLAVSDMADGLELLRALAEPPDVREPVIGVAAAALNVSSASVGGGGDDDDDDDNAASGDGRISTDELLELAFVRFGSLPRERIEAVRTGQRLSAVHDQSDKVRSENVRVAVQLVAEQYGGAVLGELEAGALFDRFVAGLDISSVGLSVPFAAFSRAFTASCAAFDGDVVDEFEPLRASGVPAAAAAGDDAPRFSLRETFERMTLEQLDLISWREFVAIVGLFVHGTPAQQLRFWCAVAADGGELLTRADALRCIATQLSHHWAGVKRADCDRLCDVLFLKLRHAGGDLRASVEARHNSDVITVDELEQLMIADGLLNNFFTQLGEIYDRRSLRRTQDDF